MNTQTLHNLARCAVAVAVCLFNPPTYAQRGRGPQGPQVVSPEVSAERRITFRILAPKAQAVRLSSGDIPGNGQGAPLAKGTNDVWEVTIGPVEPGTYRYNLNVDGVAVIDPRNPAVSESNNNVWSLVHVPGSDFADTKDVPHGAVSAVTYYSKSLGKFRRMHIYTPPGYESGKGKYPVFYLLHGAGDCDEAWTSVGRAGFILDNLIAAGKAKPMVVAMPAGHTRASGFGPPPAASTNNAAGRPPADEFVEDFLNDIMPYVEGHYRVHADRQHRAIAGLSMGGSQTLNIAMPHLDRFGYVGVFSSGLIGSFGGGRGRGTNAPAGPTWEERNTAALDDAKLKKGLKLLWFATGKDDFLIETSRRTVEMLKKHGFDPAFKESDGAHTWINWRNYLDEFAPQLFQ
ncbi:MAG: alpha/beta hydrolase-fold protein [Limisphaerales bacterium]